jgi:hypothetical protein
MEGWQLGEGCFVRLEELVERWLELVAGVVKLPSSQTLGC